MNEKEVGSKVLFGKISIPFSLPDGRQAEMRVATSGFIPEYELRVGGNLILSELERKSLACISCEGPIQPGDKFCGRCGTAVTSADNQVRLRKQREARNIIGALAAMFLVFGVVMFFLARSNSATSLGNLAKFRSTDYYPTLIHGKQYTIGEVRNSIESAPLQVLVVNLILSFVMFLLYLYAKKSPLPAILIATGIYLALQVANALVAPQTIAQGLFMKMIFIFLLIKGLRSALELRKVDA